MEHTPGPWIVTEENGWLSIRPKKEPKNLIAGPVGIGASPTFATGLMGTSQDAANAALIAAAPETAAERDHLKEINTELLEACKYALQNLKPKGNVKKDFSGWNAIAALSKAIYNAEGGESHA